MLFFPRAPTYMPYCLFLFVGFDYHIIIVELLISPAIDVHIMGSL